MNLLPGDIERVKLVTHTQKAEFERLINEAVEECQRAGFVAEIQFAGKERGNSYLALVNWIIR